MKKTATLLLSAALVLGLAACGSPPKLPASSPATSAPAASPAEQPATASAGNRTTSPAEAEAQPTTGRTLVVYYSASGNTARVAQEIANAADADLFEIVPTEVYTADDLN